MAKNLIVTFGIVFVLVGVLGLIGGVGIVGPNGVFSTDTVHDLVHLVSGILFLIVGLTAPAKSATTMVVFGIVYLLVAILGIVGNNPVLGFLNVNTADNILHVVLGLAVLGAGLATKDGAGMVRV